MSPGRVVPLLARWKGRLAGYTLTYWVVGPLHSYTQEGWVDNNNNNHIVETYSSMGLVMALYVAMIASFCFPHVVDVSALSICIVLRALVIVISMCLLYACLGSRVSPSIFGLISIGSVMLSICSSSCVLNSAGSGVKRVHVVLSGLRMKLPESMYVFHVGMIGRLLLLCRCVLMLW